MPYEPSFERTDAIDALCMEIAELVGMLSPQAPLSTSPTLRRQLRIQTIYSSLVIEGNKLDERAVSAIIDGKRVLGGSSPVEWCNRFVSFGLGYALSWSGVSSCPVGWGVSRDLVRMSRLR